MTENLPIIAEARQVAATEGPSNSLIGRGLASIQSGTYALTIIAEARQVAATAGPSNSLIGRGLASIQSSACALTIANQDIITPEGEQKLLPIVDPVFKTPD
ncbi:MAG: hypothetical protein Q8Q28_16105 [Pseudomonadota bacterium]|nr:hypothetical protein [Pseudomonadota bacterium]